MTSLLDRPTGDSGQSQPPATTVPIDNLYSPQMVAEQQRKITTKS